MSATQLAADIAAAPRRTPFAPDAMRVVGSLGQWLLRHPEAKRQPALAALGFALRPAVLRAQEEGWRARARQEPNRVTLCAGVVLHIPPANVDTLFAFMWAQSLLWGNSNIVRLPGGGGEVAATICAGMAEVLSSAPDLARSTALVAYGHDLAVTEALSRTANLRLIWGSDATVARLRALPLAAQGREVCFGSRFSLAVLRADAVLELDGAALGRLAEDFANDVFSFAQLACASPTRLIWCGAPAAGRTASIRLLTRVAEVLVARNTAFEPGLDLRKHTALHRAVLDEEVTGHRRFGHQIDLLELVHLRSPARIAPGGGLLLQTTVPTLAEVAPCLRRCDQTLCHFGFSHSELHTWAQDLADGGIDRLVPIGRALRLDHVWDGVDLSTVMTRVVSVEA